MRKGREDKDEMKNETKLRNEATITRKQRGRRGRQEKRGRSGKTMKRRKEKMMKHKLWGNMSIIVRK